MKTVDEALRSLRGAIGDLDAAMAIRARESALIPRTTADIEAAIEEWLAAEQDANAHFDRFPDSVGVAHKDTPPEARADWSRCCDRIHAAKSGLVAVAMALREARKAAAQ